ncbi:MAG: hypothetical protein JNM07_02870 [Phycisphaerae bacterium]|nr:hypothetical protein [Phycisphaerae bacterium]
MASVFESKYPVGSGSGVCAATGVPLSTGVACVAALVEDEPGGALRRIDFLAREWDAGARPNAPARLFGHWRTVVREVGRDGPALLDDDALQDLFEQLAESNEARRQAFRFVLGLLLIRKRLLVASGTVRRPDGTSVLLVRRKGEDRDRDLVDPGMDEATIAEVIDEIGGVLGGRAGGSRAVERATPSGEGV